MFYKYYWYKELYNQIMERNKSVSINLHTDLHKWNSVASKSD